MIPMIAMIVTNAKGKNKFLFWYSISSKNVSG